MNDQQDSSDKISQQLSVATKDLSQSLEPTNSSQDKKALAIEKNKMAQREHRRIKENYAKSLEEKIAKLEKEKEIWI